MHPEALNKKGKEIFSKFSTFSDFYLAGGTALALQIGHRISVDFDFFSKKPIEKNFLPKVKQVFSGKAVAPSVDNSDELTVFVDEVKLTFLYYPFPLLRPLPDYRDVSLLGIKEISATKAYTIGRRGSFKDYVDLYFVISERHAALTEIMELAGKKYGQDFNSRLFLEQLVYLKDIEDTKVIFLKNKATKRDLEDFFTKEVAKIKL